MSYAVLLQQVSCLIVLLLRELTRTFLPGQRSNSGKTVSYSLDLCSTRICHCNMAEDTFRLPKRRSVVFLLLIYTPNCSY